MAAARPQGSAGFWAMAKFVRGQSGNPAGSSRVQRERRQFNLGIEARKFARLALDTLVEIAKAEVPGTTPRDRVAAANAILDRGFGRPTQQVDMTLMSKRLSEMTTQELVELNSRLTPSVSIGTAIAAAEPEQPPQSEEVIH
jgi:hypothetical protein